MKTFEFAFTLNAMMQGNVVTTSKEAYKALENMNKAMGRLKSKYEDLSDAQDIAIADMKKYKTAMQQLEAEYKSGRINANTYNIKLEEMQRQFNVASIRAQGLKRDINAVSQEMNEYKSTKAIAEARGKFNASFQNAIGAYASFQGAMSIAQKITAPIMDGVKAAMTFESAMADVRKVVDFDSPQGFKEMQQDILNLSTTLPMIPEDIARIVAAGGQAGIPREELMKFAESAAKMGVAFDVTADQAGDMMAKWRTAFKMNQAEVIELADKINYLGNTTAAGAVPISDIVTRIGPLGDVAGVASGEIAALGASMAGAGIPSEIAATGIKNMMLAMASGESATKKQAEAFDLLGFTAEGVAVRMQTDAKGAIIDLMEAIKGLDASRQASVMQDLFGKESLSAIGPLLSNLDNLKENFDKVADSAQYTGSMEDEYAERSKTAENAMILMENAMKKVNIEIGNVFLPYMTTAMQYLSEYGAGIAKWVSEHETLTAVIGGVTLAIAGLGVGITAIGLTLSVIQTAAAGFAFLRTAIEGVNIITRITTATTKAFQAVQAMAKLSVIGFSMASTIARTAMLGLNAAMLANPVGLVIAGIAALIAIGYVLIENWDTVKEYMTAIWESPAAAMLAFMTGPIGMLIYIVSGIIANWEDIKAWFTLLWNDPSAAMEQFCNFFSEKLMGLWNKAKEYGAKIAEALTFGVFSADGGAADVSHNATGGIYRKGPFLTTFAEEGPEAAIPLDGSPRAMSLWQQAGQMLGMIPDNSEPSLAAKAMSMAENISETTINNTNNSNTSNQNISISIPVTVNGNADGPAISSMQSVVEETVRRALADIKHQEGRVSFA